MELFCDCPVDACVDRFSKRDCHPGHLDKHRDPSELIRSFEDNAGKLAPVSVRSHTVTH